MAKKRGAVIRVGPDIKEEIEKFRKKNKLHSQGEVVRIWRQVFIDDKLEGKKTIKIGREIQF